MMSEIYLIIQFDRTKSNLSSLYQYYMRYHFISLLNRFNRYKNIYRSQIKHRIKFLSIMNTIINIRQSIT